MDQTMDAMRARGDRMDVTLGMLCEECGARIEARLEPGDSRAIRCGCGAVYDHVTVIVVDQHGAGRPFSEAMREAEGVIARAAAKAEAAERTWREGGATG